MTQPISNAITSLADLRPGDIGIMRMGGFIPGFLPVRVGQWMCGDSFTIGPYSADHVLICVEGAKSKDAGLRLIIDNRGYTQPRAVQAMPRGAEEIPLTLAKHWTDGVAWFRLPEDYPGQALDAAAIARLFVSERVPYSFLSYLALAAWSRGLKAQRLERWIDRRGPRQRAHFASAGVMYPALPGGGVDVALPREAICSVLVDQAWSLAGKRVIEGVAHQCVTPGRMAIQLSRRAGVIVGGPGFLL